MSGPEQQGRWGGKGIPDLQAGVDRYPASQQPVLRETVNRDFGGSQVRADGQGIIVWRKKGAPGVFVVKVASDGGDAGGVGTDCSLTYTVTDLSGRVLGTGVSPEQSRYPETTYLPAGADGRSFYGIAGYDENGNLLLLKIDEIADATTC